MEIVNISDKGVNAPGSHVNNECVAVGAPVLEGVTTFIRVSGELIILQGARVPASFLSRFKDPNNNVLGVRSKAEFDALYVKGANWEELFVDCPPHLVWLFYRYTYLNGGVSFCIANPSLSVEVEVGTDNANAYVLNTCVAGCSSQVVPAAFDVKLAITEMYLNRYTEEGTISAQASMDKLDSLLAAKNLNPGEQLGHGYGTAIQAESFKATLARVLGPSSNYWANPVPIALYAGTHTALVLPTRLLPVGAVAVLTSGLKQRNVVAMPSTSALPVGGIVSNGKVWTTSYYQGKYGDMVVSDSLMVNQTIVSGSAMQLGTPVTAGVSASMLAGQPDLFRSSTNVTVNGVQAGDHFSIVAGGTVKTMVHPGATFVYDGVPNEPIRVATLLAVSDAFGEKALSYTTDAMAEAIAEGSASDNLATTRSSATAESSLGADTYGGATAFTELNDQRYYLAVVLNPVENRYADLNTALGSGVSGTNVALGTALNGWSKQRISFVMGTGAQIKDAGAALLNNSAFAGATTESGTGVTLVTVGHIVPPTGYTIAQWWAEKVKPVANPLPDDYAEQHYSLIMMGSSSFPVVAIPWLKKTINDAVAYYNKADRFVVTTADPNYAGYKVVADCLPFVAELPDVFDGVPSGAYEVQRWQAVKNRATELQYEWPIDKVSSSDLQAFDAAESEQKRLSLTYDTSGTATLTNADGDVVDSTGNTVVTSAAGDTGTDWWVAGIAGGVGLAVGVLAGSRKA